MSRYVPEFLARGDLAALRKLSGSLMTLRMGTGVLGAAIYYIFLRWWLRDVDPLVLFFVAFTITLRIASALPYTLLLGLNQASRWGAGELMRRALMFPLIYAGHVWGGLRGACAALAAVECAVLMLGLWWSRGYIDVPSLPIDRPFLKPYLQFSAVFFAGNLLVTFFQQGGAPLIRLVSGDYREAGYFAVAFGAYQAGAFILWNLVNGFNPLMSTLRIKGETARVQLWTGRLLRAIAVSAVLVAGLVYSCTDLLVSHVLGQRYGRVAELLPLLALAGVASGPGGIARMLSVSYDLGWVSIQGGVVQLASFAALGCLLIPRMGSVGACVAVVAATVLFSAYSTWRVRQEVRYSMGGWLGAVALGALCSPVLWGWNAAGPLRFAVFVTIYTGMALAMGIIRVAEGKQLARAMRRAA